MDRGSALEIRSEIRDTFLMHTLTPKLQAELDRIVDTIVAKFDPEKVILFGSRAWGKPGPDSDADLLVVGKSQLGKWERLHAIRAALPRHTLPVDVLAYTPTELRDAIDRQRNLFLEDIVKHGKVVYAKDTARRAVAAASS